MTRSTPPAVGAADTRPLALPIAGLAIGVWSLLPPYVGPELNTATRVEIVDHVVPAVLVLAVSAGMVLLRRGFETAGFLGGLAVLLAGLWMTATHVPLVGQALAGQVAAGAVVFHSAPGVAVAGLGLLWALRSRGTTG